METINFLVPSQIQENLLCNWCFRFLSVKPVKMYKDGVIKCGRCSNHKDDGVISLYNNIATRSIFKCINRFDGCKELLSCDDVVQHEAKCEAKKYTCPMCLYSAKIPSYLLMEHFKRKHRPALMNSNCIEFNEFNKDKKYFLYRLEDNLFFIIVENIHSGNSELVLELVEILTINCLLLGDCKEAKKFTVKFKITSGFTNKYENGEIQCGTYPSFNEGATYVSILKNPDQTSGILYIDIQKNAAELIRLPVQKRKSTVAETQNKQTKYCPTLCLKTAYFQRRNVLLNNNVCKVVPTMTLSDDCTYLTFTAKKHVEVFLTCFNCSLVNYSLIENENICFIKLNMLDQSIHRFYLICFPCSKALPVKQKHKQLVFAKRHFEEISLFCKWRCGEYHNANFIQTHEGICKCQPVQKCPVQSCKCLYRQNEFKDHFEDKHNQKISISVDLVELYLNTSEPNIEHYFLISHIFVKVRFIWEQPFWNISLSCALEGVVPRLIILNDSNELISYIKDNGKLTHKDCLKVKCYVVDPEKEYAGIISLER